MIEKIHVDPTEAFPLSPYLYMQFMEPLGTADSSVDAGWDFLNDCWRPKLIEAVQYLAPPMVRWGGCFASYYRWKEAVGPQDCRKPMLNLCWDGVYMNQAGTAEVVDFCRQAGAEPLLTVNMESDGRKHWAYPKPGVDRLGSAEEAAEWVDYCNNPSNELRRSHGAAEPYRVKYWQIGNETSYDPNGFTCEETAAVTARFAKAMRAVDPSIRLIAWGDSGWAGKICEETGHVIDYIAFHHHFNSGLPDSPLYGTEYRRDFARTWEHLMNAHKSLQTHIDEVREQVAPYGKRLAITEGHFDMKGRNRCELLSSWAAGVSYARLLNVLERNGDIVDIGTMADFFGNRWQVNAIIVPTPLYPKLKPYLQPVGWVMSLFRRHMGEHSVKVSVPSGLDISASRSGNKLFLHVANVNLDKPVKASIEIDGMAILGGAAHEICCDPQLEITQLIPDAFMPVDRTVSGPQWEFPAASVTAMELDIEECKA